MASSAKKEDNLVGKLTNTLTRKKKREYDKLNAEILNALEGPAMVKKTDEELVADSDEIVMIDPHFKRESTEYQALVQTLIEWLNAELAFDRVIVRSLEEDLYDGLLLSKLVDKLYGTNVAQAQPEIIASEAGHKQRVRAVLQAIVEQMQIPAEHQAMLPWTLELVYGKNEVALVRLLLAMARHSSAPIRLPDSLLVHLIIVQKRDGGILQTVRAQDDLALPLDFALSRGETDAFDTLFEHTPDKIPQVTRALSMWLNNHLRRLAVDVDDLAQLADGAYLVMLVGLLEGYFVPLFSFHVAPRTTDEKAANVRLAFELLTDASVQLPARIRPADIVNGDLRSIVRFVYHVFQFYANRDRERALQASAAADHQVAAGEDAEGAQAEAEDDDYDYETQPEPEATEDRAFVPPPVRFTE